MGGSTRRKLRSQIICERTLDDGSEGTSARTRPLSYDEIMVKRKSKKELGGFGEDTETMRFEETVRNSDHQSSNPNGDRQRRDSNGDHQSRDVNAGRQSRDTNGAARKNSREYPREPSPGKRVDKDFRTEHTHSKSGNKERRDVESISMQKHDNDVRNATESKNHRDGRKSKADDDSRGDARNNNENTHRKDSVAQDRYAERNAGAFERENKRKDRNGDDEKYRMRDPVKRRDSGSKVDEGSGGVARYNHENKHHKDCVTQDRYIERKAGVNERDCKRKDRSGDDENSRMRDSVREHGTGNRRDSVILEKKEKTESSRSRHDEAKRKDRSGDDENYRMRDFVKEFGTGNRRDSEIFEKKEKAESSRSRYDEAYKKDRSGDGENNRMRDSVKEHDAGSRWDSEILEKKENTESSRSRHDEARMRDSVKEHGAGSRRDSEILDKKENTESFRSRHDEARIRDSVKDHGAGSRWGNLEKKENTESSRSHHDEARSKRRRSRSQERTIDKTRRSSSSSPKPHKNMSYHAHDHSEPLRSERERSRRHPDVDCRKMSGDGSSTNQRRHGVSSSGLGGYSPRKRKSEAAVKTPSPIRSPERKSAGWDLPPSGSDKNLTTAIPSGTQLMSHTKHTNMIELAAGFSVASSMGKPIPAILSNNLSAFKQASIDSVQLTQATRPMRRLYIDNIPGSVTEKDIMECFNTFLLSSGYGHMRGTPPCISCMIHKEKGQALVEFLTPEDASTALSFDGRSLCGSILKVRRPKDYVETQQVPSGTSEKLEPGGDLTSEVAVTDFVKDSPHKIFVGGIAEGLSSGMIMEIVSAFGTLKAYRFEVNGDVGEPCAFLEFADPSATLKACAGLNGMKLGGRFLTVSQVFPDAEIVENSRSHPFYGIPDHVKPLLQMPTQVLKLSNLLDQKDMDSLSDADLEEALDDVRLECSRFGSIVSINVVRSGDNHAPILEANDFPNDVDSVQLSENKNHQLDMNPVEGGMYLKDGDVSNGELPTNIKEIDAGDSVEGSNDEPALATTNSSVEVTPSAGSPVGKSKENDASSEQSCVKAGDDPQDQDALIGVLTVDDMLRVSDSDGALQQPTSFKDIEMSSEFNSHESSIKSKDGENLHADEGVLALEEKRDALPKAVLSHPDSGTPEIENSFNRTNVFEVGSVLVEFKRTEASCMAAHCLHGRTFDDRVVSVEYVPLKAYRDVFPK